MTEKNLRNIKIIGLFISLILIVWAGFLFYEHRTFAEAVVPSPQLTEVKKLSSYFAPLTGTVNDCNLYFFDSGNPGGTLFLIGGTHPEEPAPILTAQLFAENARIRQGRLIVAIRANRSASTVTRPGDAYPRFYTIPTSWGEKKFRMGDRWTNPLDSWPDPEVYVHYPSGQMLAYMDIRNFNRTWPGRPNGLITEQTSYAMMELIRQEEVNFFIDMHEAELEYPVISTIVTHESGQEIAATASMMLTEFEFARPIGMEFSPPSLHGLTHREVGDNSDAISLLFETPEPFLDRVRGITDEELLLTGKDAFVMEAGKYGLLYEKIDEQGWPIDVRVGRHCSTVLETVQTYSDMNPDQPILIEGIPRYQEVIDNGTGFYLHNPEEAEESQVFYE